MKAIRIEKEWRDQGRRFFQVAIGDEADMPKRGKEVLEFNSRADLDALIEQERNPSAAQLLARMLADEPDLDNLDVAGRSINRKFEAVSK